MNTKMGRILLIEDCGDMRTLITQGLQDSFDVTGVATIAAANEALRAHEVNLVLLDVALPDGNGIKWLAELRNSSLGQDLPVIFISGGMDVDDRVLGFTLGAEDVLIKPFHPAELKARVVARLRLRKKIDQSNTEILRGNLRINTAKQAVWVGEEEKSVDLTSHEYKILCYLATRPEAVYTRDQIISGAWGSEVHVYERTVDSHISRLRKKLRGSSHTIVSVRGSGYSFGPTDEC